MIILRHLSQNFLENKPVQKTKKDPKRLSVERIYQKKTQLEHILLRPDSYIGSVEPVTQVRSHTVMSESLQKMAPLMYLHWFKSSGGSQRSSSVGGPFEIYSEESWPQYRDAWCESAFNEKQMDTLRQINVWFLSSLLDLSLQQMWVYDKDVGLNCRDVTFVPGLYKIFDEILGE